MNANAECGKSCEILFACDADKRFDMKVKCSTGRGPHLGQIPHCAEKNSSQKPGICPGGMGGVRIDWYIRQLRGLDSNRTRIFRSNYVTTLNPTVTKYIK